MLTDKMFLGFYPHHLVAVPYTFFCVGISEKSFTGAGSCETMSLKEMQEGGEGEERKSHGMVEAGRYL